MLLGEIIAVYCENHAEHINTLCGQIAEFLNVRARRTRIAQSVFQRATHWTAGVRFPALGPNQPSVQWVPGAISAEMSGWSVKLINHLHLGPKLRMRGAILPLPHKSSWRGV
jgi:hypothetical protein